MGFNLKDLESEILDQYFEKNQRPWILGFSGGKDSTMLLQVVWNTLKSVRQAPKERDIYVVCNNTLVENPKIIEYTEKVLDKIQEEASKQNLPFKVVRTTPRLEDSFWTNLIGKGYPAPNNMFRWCTERLKINPTTKFIKEKIDETGEVIILLGTRSDESSARARSIKKHEVTGQRLRKHVLPNAYVYAPIKDVTIDELWQYLLQVSSPWGSNNKELVTIYRNANSGDCPLVIDDSTPSCGNSRFGCWVCTVVTKDRSMEALIENGEEWMEPLMELRDLLSASREDRDKRETKRRNGMSGADIWGPYTPAFRAEFLDKLLRAQKEIQSVQRDITLINYQELVAIQVLWYRDNIFNFNVADIYNNIYGTDIQLENGNQAIKKEKELLKKVCKESEDFELINELLALQKTKTLLMTNRGLQNDLENKLDDFISSRDVKDVS
ncbi:MAG: hypothetical protein BroJett005_11570 [Ignavibacteriota bacterium]|nr:MAG: hypothetical protein BroJett005_11570 [Ignavibacteriota bacterium]